MKAKRADSRALTPYLIGFLKDPLADVGKVPRSVFTLSCNQRGMTRRAYTAALLAPWNGAYIH